jgi:hypothetical protein
MADTVTTQIIDNGGRNYTVVLTNISVGTGESAIIKVDKSGLLNALGQIPTLLRIRKVQWCIAGFAYVRLHWDHTTDDTALVLTAGVGELCFEHLGDLPDPNTAGDTGDLLLTAVPITSATQAAYTIVLELHK